VVALGVAIGFAMVELLNPVVGSQLNKVAPLDDKLKEDPAQILPPEPTVNTGDELTVTVTLAVDEHPFDTPVTVYVWVVEGLATGLEIVPLLRPTVDDHMYEVAPEAVKFVVFPEHISFDEAFAEIVGRG
jgi:hypothetical protein